MKGYKTIDNEIILTPNERTDCGNPICDRPFTPEETLWHSRGCLKIQGNDVVIDTVKKSAYIRNSVKQYTDDGSLIDKKTLELLSSGLPHPNNPSVIFSLSIEAQISMLGLHAKKAELTYPWPLSKKGGGYHLVQDIAELDLISNAIFSRVAELKKLGNIDKIWLNDVNRTDLEISNYVDSRI